MLAARQLRIGAARAVGQARAFAAPARAAPATAFKDIDLNAHLDQTVSAWGAARL